MYAALYVAFGHVFLPIVVLNVILSTAIVGLTIGLSSELFDQKIGLPRAF